MLDLGDGDKYTANVIGETFKHYEIVECESHVYVQTRDAIKLSISSDRNKGTNDYIVYQCGELKKVYGYSDCRSVLESYIKKQSQKLEKLQNELSDKYKEAAKLLTVCNCRDLERTIANESEKLDSAKRLLSKEYEELADLNDGD